MKRVEMMVVCSNEGFRNNIRRNHFFMQQKTIFKQAETTDDLRKSRGLHSISAYRHGLYI